MVEVFKTNVENPGQAAMLLDQIHRHFRRYKANFDLDDCDKILRVKCETEYIQPFPLINLLQQYGYQAEVLPDD